LDTPFDIVYFSKKSKCFVFSLFNSELENFQKTIYFKIALNIIFKLFILNNSFSKYLLN